MAREMIFQRSMHQKEVIAMLNPLKDQIYAVRGNCDTEVDQMVLQFPILADYALLVLDGKTFYATHGHVFNQDHLPPMQDGDILVHGHTHLLKAEKVETECGTITVLNPGSVSIPKGGNQILMRSWKMVYLPFIPWTAK